MEILWVFEEVIFAENFTQRDNRYKGKKKLL